jgi:hypothetical protein
MLGVLAERGPVRSVGVNQRLLGRAAYSALLGILRASLFAADATGASIDREEHTNAQEARWRDLRSGCRGSEY